MERLADADHACDELKNEIKNRDPERPSLLETRGEERKAEGKKEPLLSGEMAEEKKPKASAPPKSPPRKPPTYQNLPPKSSSGLAPYTSIDYANIPLTPEKTVQQFREPPLRKESTENSFLEREEESKNHLEGEIEEAPAKKKKTFLQLALEEESAVRREIQDRMLHESTCGVNIRELFAKIDTREKLLLYRDQGSAPFL